MKVLKKLKLKFPFPLNEIPSDAHCDNFLSVQLPRMRIRTKSEFFALPPAITNPLFPELNNNNPHVYSLHPRKTSIAALDAFCHPRRPRNWQRTHSTRAFSNQSALVDKSAGARGWRFPHSPCSGARTPGLRATTVTQNRGDRHHLSVVQKIIGRQYQISAQTPSIGSRCMTWESERNKIVIYSNESSCRANPFLTGALGCQRKMLHVGHCRRPWIEISPTAGFCSLCNYCPPLFAHHWHTVCCISSLNFRIGFTALIRDGHFAEKSQGHYTAFCVFFNVIE